jgi:TPR repeat protein
MPEAQSEKPSDAASNVSITPPPAPTIPPQPITPQAVALPPVKPKIERKVPAMDASVDALETQGENYLYGHGVEADCGRASKTLLAAAARSSAKAQSVLGTMYATGHCVTRDVPTAYRWFAKALHQDPGNIRIQRDLEVLWQQMTEEERKLAMQTGP